MEGLTNFDSYFSEFKDVLSLERKITRERWEGIKQCRKEFFENENADPSKSPHMDREVAASWIRSRSFKVDHRSFERAKRLTRKEYDGFLKQNRLLIDTAKPLFDSFNTD
ncbi:MAG: hypothetical protein HPY50_20925 [Firmicutes bacterium]|nr:hypothetical protein [Bacillota bacterium]